MHEMDRHELDRSEPAVDPAHELVHRRAQVLVFFDVLAGGDGELCEDDLCVCVQMTPRCHIWSVRVVCYVRKGLGWGWRGRGRKGKTHLADPFGMLSEEELERV